MGTQSDVFDLVVDVRLENKNYFALGHYPSDEIYSLALRLTRMAVNTGAIIQVDLGSESSPLVLRVEPDQDFEELVNLLKRTFN